MHPVKTRCVALVVILILPVLHFPRANVCGGNKMPIHRAVMSMKSTDVYKTLRMLPSTQECNVSVWWINSNLYSSLEAEPANGFEVDLLEFMPHLHKRAT